MASGISTSKSPAGEAQFSGPSEKPSQALAGQGLGNRRERVRRGLFDVVACLAIAIVAIVAQSPYFQLDFQSDDVAWLVQLGALRTVEWKHPWTNWIFFNGTDTIAPLFRVIWYGMWKAFGVEILPWRFTIALFHALSAALLYAALRRYFASRGACLFGALIWAGVAFETFNTSFGWMVCAYQFLAASGFFVAMIGISLVRERPRVGVALALAGTLVALESWNFFLLLTPVLPLQYLLLERPSRTAPRVERLGRAAWLLLVAAQAVWQVVYSLGKAPDRQPDLGIGAIKRMAEFAPQNFYYLVPVTTSRALVAVLLALFSAVVVLLVARNWQNRAARLLLVFAALTGIAIVVTGIMREALVERYCYTPVLGMYACAAIVLDLLLPAAGGRRALVGGLVALYAIGLRVEQHAIALRSVADEERIYGHVTRELAETRASLARFEDWARRQPGPVRVLDSPLDVRDIDQYYSFPLRCYAAAVRPSILRFVKFVTPDEERPGDLEETSRVLKALEDHRARVWLERVRSLHDKLAAIAWLERVASEDQQTVRFPGVTLRDPRLRMSISLLAMRLAFARPLERVVLFWPRGITDESLRGVDSLLARHVGPESAILRRMILEALREDQQSPGTGAGSSDG